jgi:DNA polymerase III subunit delta
VTAHAPAYLIIGHELLVRRAADRIIDDLRANGDVEVTDLRAEALKEQGLPDLTGSLFGTPRVVRIREAQDLTSDLADAIIAQLKNPSPDATLILQASSAGRSRKLAKRIDELGGRIDVAPPKDWEDRKWQQLVGDEFTRHGRTTDPAACQAILDHAGLDVGAIAEKVGQVVAAQPAKKVTAAHVEALVEGHGNRGAFAVADAMCDRDPAKAAGLLRGVLDGGQDPVMVLGALTYRMRTVVAVAGGVDGKTIGANISPGQARRLGALRRNFGPGELTRAYRVLADADLALKSGELPPEHVVERAVVDIATPAAPRGS